MQIRAPKSIGFGAKRAEKSPYKRTIPYDASLGPRGTEFKYPHSTKILTESRVYSPLSVIFRDRIIECRLKIPFSFIDKTEVITANQYLSYNYYLSIYS